MKKNNLLLKIFIIVITIISILLIINEPTYAATTLSGDALWQDGRDFINIGSQNSPISAQKIGEILTPLANILLAIGTVVVVIVGVVMGIKYVTSPPDAQGKLKTQLVGLFISTVVLYGAYGIWTISYNILKDLF